MSKAPGSEHRHLRQAHVGYDWQGCRRGFPGPLKLTLCHHILQMLQDSLSAGFGSNTSVPSCLFFFTLFFWNEDVSCYILEMFNLLFSGAHS